MSIYSNTQSRRVTKTIVPIAAVLPQLTACSGVQSALDPASPAAELIADFWYWMLAVATLVTVLVVALLWMGVRRATRPRPSEPLSVRQSRRLVIAGGVILPLAAIVPFAVSSFSIGTFVDSPRPADVVVEVVGKRWWWEVRYLGPSGRRIATTANEIHIPVDATVRFLLRSDNVVHSFWVPTLMGKLDMIPGRDNHLTTVAERTGVYRGQCAEYCGEQHALMALLVVVEPAEDFERWLSRQRQPALEPRTPLQRLGRRVFLESTCADCHPIRGVATAADLGPDLTHIGSRRTLAAATLPNTVGHLGGWISDPQHVKPEALMPPTELSPEALKALIAYLESLE